VTVLEGDLLDPVAEALRGEVDLIVSNPPYIDPDELDDLPPEVRADPDTALAGGTDFHRRLVDAGPIWLRPGGSLVVEIGSTQAEEIAGVFERGGFAAVEVRQDLTGRDRVVAGRLRG
jgi:release factor glutamine methyltransferase